MNFYKNTEVAKKYNVSVDTVANWIRGSLENRNQLELLLKKDRKYILDTASNHFILNKLSSRSSKFKNKKFLKQIKPSEDFYNMYTKNQLIDLISALETHKEIDMKFIYFKDGAKYWDDLYKRSLIHNGFSIQKNTQEILNISQKIIFSIMKKYEKVDIIDLGVGNGQHIVGLLEKLETEGILNQYVGLDYSLDMLDIAKFNISNSLKNTSHNIFAIHDLTHELISKYLFQKTNMKIGKFIFFIGSTIENIKDYSSVLRLIKNSLNRDDILVIGNSLKSQTSRQLLNFNHKTESPHLHKDGYLIVLERLGLSDDLYEVERYYDESSDTRYAKAKLKYDIEILFSKNDINRTIRLTNKDTITVYRHTHHTLQQVNNLLNNEGFRILHSVTSSDYSNVITICMNEVD